MQHAHHGVVPPKTARRPLLSTGSAAALAGCHRVTIVRAIQAGELEAVRLGKRGDYRIRPDALNDWITPAHNPKVTTP
jgi:excisionase family DNA binding protein